MTGETILNDHSFLVTETDIKGNIKFANDDFCKIAGYSLAEIIDKPHNMIRHKDMPKKAFKSLWDTIQAGNVWTGYVKNTTKNGGFYWVFATVFPFQSCDGSQGYLSCRRKASREEIVQAETLYEKWSNEN